MYPTPERPAFGRFVYDQVQALRTLPGLDVEVFEFTGGGLPAYARAAAQARRQFAGRRFDVVHAHFGLSSWPGLAIRAKAHAVTLHGTDLVHPRSRPVTLAALPFMDLVGAVSIELAQSVPAWAARTVEVLPCGVDLERFKPIERRAARAELGLDPDGRYLLFPADPARPEKRYDLALELQAAFDAGPGAGDHTLLTLGNVEPERVALFVNAANAVVIPSDREGFGLAVLEALACDVPVCATPHGVAPEALAGVAGTYCGRFSPETWSAALAPHLLASDPRVAGHDSALRYSAVTLAGRVADGWRALIG
jgi:teichuronic acid biosynthesis glycosyltransferase TuaC